MVPRRNRSFSREFKLMVVRQLSSGEKRMAQLCREHALSNNLLRYWRDQYARDGEQAWREGRTPSVDPEPQAQIEALEKALGRAHVRIELLEAALEACQKRGSRLGRSEP